MKRAIMPWDGFRNATRGYYTTSSYFTVFQVYFLKVPLFYSCSKTRKMPIPWMITPWVVFGWSSEILDWLNFGRLWSSFRSEIQAYAGSRISWRKGSDQFRPPDHLSRISDLRRVRPRRPRGLVGLGFSSLKVFIVFMQSCMYLSMFTFENKAAQWWWRV